MEKKVAVVTGASRGIGAAIARELAKAGMYVVINYCGSEEKAQELKTEIEQNGGEASIYKCDVSDNVACKEFIGNVIAEYGHLDVLVNNAGISNTKPLHFISEEEYEKVLAVNTKAPIFLTNLLYKRKKIKKNASIVFMSSLAGLYTFTPANGLYSLSKGAITSYSKSCAVEFAVRGIRSNSVHPSMVNTDLKMKLSFSEEDYKKDMQKYLLKRYAEPFEIAYAVIFLLSDAASYITGHTLIIDGGRSLK